MRLIVAGGRDYVPTDEDRAWLNEICIDNNVHTIISGGATGADAFGESYARCKALRLVIVKANWRSYGKSAGPRRNEEMAKQADAVALFPGGKGTASMKQIAIRYGLKVFER